MDALRSINKNCFPKFFIVMTFIYLFTYLICWSLLELTDWLVYCEKDAIAKEMEIQVLYASLPVNE